MIRWIKSHPWVTAGIVAGVLLLYWLYKRGAFSGSGSSAASLPNFVYVGSGGGGGSGGGPVAPYGGSSIGIPATAAPSAAAVATGPSQDISVTPGTAPAPVVSAPASVSAASAVVNQAPGAPGIMDESSRLTPISFTPSSGPVEGERTAFGVFQGGQWVSTITSAQIAQGVGGPGAVAAQAPASTAPASAPVAASKPIMYNDLGSGLFGGNRDPRNYPG